MLAVPETWSATLFVSTILIPRTKSEPYSVASLSVGAVITVRAAGRAPWSCTAYTPRQRSCPSGTGPPPMPVLAGAGSIPRASKNARRARFRPA